MKLLFIFLFAISTLYSADSIEYFEDTDSSKTINTILNVKEFQPYDKSLSNFGMSRSTFWLKISFQNQTDKENQKVLHFNFPMLDSIKLFELKKDSLVQVDKKGHLVGDKESNKLSPSLVFELGIEANSQAVYYLQVNSAAPMNLSLDIYSHEDFVEYKLAWLSSNTFYLGAVLIIIVYNLMLFFNISSKLYLYYVFFHTGFLLLLFSLNGFALKFIYPQNPEISTLFIPMLIALTATLQVLFVYELLEIKKHGRKTKKIMQIVMAYGIFALLAIIFIPYRESILMANSVSFMGLSLTLFVAIYFWAKKNSVSAKYYTIAWLLLTFGIVVEHLKNNAFIPTNIFTTNAMQVGVLVELIMLSMVLAYRFNTIEAKNIELRGLVATDTLTKIKNRRYFLERMDELLALLKRKHEPHALVMLDIDHFKMINDTYGHVAGDKVLVEFSDKISSTLREEDIFARVGGEEFVLLVRSNIEGITKLTKRIKDSIEALIVSIDKHNINITVSMGVTIFEDGDKNCDTLLNEADTALYQAKLKGRNRVEFFSKED